MNALSGLSRELAEVTQFGAKTTSQNMYTFLWPRSSLGQGLLNYIKWLILAEMEQVGV